MISLKRFTFVSLMVVAAAVASAAEPVKVGNKTCPVMADKAVKENQSVTYKDQVVSLCCKRCVKNFNEKPDEYLKKAKELAKAGK